MKEYIKKFANNSAAHGHIIDNPFTSVVSETGQKITCINGDFAFSENGTVVIFYKLPKPADNEIYYRTDPSAPVTPNTDTLLGENNTVLHIVSNEYDKSFDGYRMVLDGDLVKIADNAFYKACAFRQIRFPDTLERVCYRSFRQCSNNWMTVEFGTGIKYIEEQAFHAINLVNLVLPSTLVAVGPAFWYSGIYNLDGILKIPANPTLDRLFANAWGFNTVLFEEGRTEISSLFNGADPSDVKHIILPSTILTLGQYAFRGLNLLADINLPNGLQSIGKYALSETGLTSITIPGTVTNLDYACFYNCSNLESITLNTGITTIGLYAFSATKISTITIPNTVTTIDEGAFWKCTSLQSITIPSSVTTLKSAAFDNCTSLQSVLIPSNVTIVEDYAFAGCSNLQSISVDSGNQVYDSRNNCNAIIETSTNKIVVGNIDITVIPNTVTTIGYAAFAMENVNTRTNSVDIPASVTTIEKWAFEAIPTLTTVTCRATTPPTLDALAFEGSTNIAHIYVPAESVETYKAATNWSSFASIIEAISE